jgi:predicted transposase/invertase (TIGR01784 family)
MSEERLNPLNDFLFMKYMGEKGDEEQLIAFLKAVLHKTKRDNIVSVTIPENRSLTADVIGDKSVMLDVCAKMADGSRVNIEVQLSDNVQNMDKRSLFYWSRKYVEDIESGDDYVRRYGVITINILKKEFLSVNDIHTGFHFREDTYKECLLSEVLEMHFIDMVKFARLESNDRDIVNNRLYRWLTFFDKNTSAETVQKIIGMDSAIKKAHEKIMFVAQDNDLLHAYRMHEMEVSDSNDSDEQNISFAINLKRKGFSIEEIAYYAMLTKEEVIKICKEQGLV